MSNVWAWTVQALAGTVKAVNIPNLPTTVHKKK